MMKELKSVNYKVPIMISWKISQPGLLSPDVIFTKYRNFTQPWNYVLFMFLQDRTKTYGTKAPLKTITLALNLTLNITKRLNLGCCPQI